MVNANPSADLMTWASVTCGGVGKVLMYFRGLSLGASGITEVNWLAQLLTLRRLPNHRWLFFFF